MTKFADQLFDDLMREHGPTLASTAMPAAQKRHPATRPALMAVGVGGVAAAATVGTLVAGGGTPAYAVTTNSNGTVTLAVHQKSGIAQANGKLRSLGERVVVVPVGPHCPSITSLPGPGPRAHGGGKVTVQASSSADGSMTVDAHGIPAGDTLVVAFEPIGKGVLGASGLTSGPVPACVSIPAPPPGGGKPVRGGSSGGPSWVQGPGGKAGTVTRGGGPGQTTGTG